MKINDYFVFSPAIVMTHCEENACYVKCPAGGIVYVDGKESSKMNGKISCKSLKSINKYEWRPRVGSDPVLISCSTEKMPDDTDTSSQGASGQSAGACPDVSTVMDIQEGVNVKCGGKFCSFSCQNSDENVSRKQIQCKGAKYKLKKNEPRTVKCSNDPPCGSLAPGESFDYNPNIMTVHYERKGKGKIHGSAVFKCKSEEEKIIELKRKSSNAVSARLYRKSVHVQQFAQYDETGFYVACKGSKWQHGKKGKKIMFKCE